jgi:hypothetical protein
MALALKVGQRTRLSVSFMRVDGSPGPVTSPPTWTSSNPALVAVRDDPAAPEGLSVYVECLGPVDPTVTAPSCSGKSPTKPGQHIMAMCVGHTSKNYCGGCCQEWARHRDKGACDDLG